MKMIESNKTYGFTIAVKELRETVPNIFRYASAYKRKNNLKSKGLWEMFLEPSPDEEVAPEAEKKQQSKLQRQLPEEILQTEPGDNNLDDIDPEAMEGESYNMCHFWSNFEIARLDWFRSKEYEDFFNTMDRSGGFWMERVSVNPMVRLSPLLLTTDSFRSGVMLPSILSLRALSLVRRTSITSVTSATDTPRSNTAPPMLLLGSSPENPTLRRPLKTRRRELKKTSTGLRQIRSRRTV